MNSPAQPGDEVSPASWDLIIRPRTSVFDLRLGEVWHYRDLILLFVRRDFVAQYKQTILGPLWHIIQPLLTTFIFLFLFGKVAKIGTDGVEPVLFYLAGISIWNYFSACLTTTSNTFITNANIFGKVYFPRLTLPISVVISNIIRFGIQFGLLLAFMIAFHFKGVQIGVTWKWLFIPLVVLVMAGIALGSGIIISSLSTKYRDLSLLLTFAVQLAMYLTPIAYPLSFLAGTKYAWLVSLNPLTGVTEAFRYCLFGRATLSSGMIAYGIGFMLLVLFLGALVFNRVEKSFMDTV